MDQRQINFIFYCCLFGVVWTVGGSRIHSCVIPFGSLHNTDRITLQKEAVKMVFVCSTSMVLLLRSN